MPADDVRADDVHATILKAYRWQYIVSGAMEPRFQKVLGRVVNAAQMQRIEEALAPLMACVPRQPEAAVTMTH